MYGLLTEFTCAPFIIKLNILLQDRGKVVLPQVAGNAFAQDVEDGSAHEDGDSRDLSNHIINCEPQKNQNETLEQTAVQAVQETYNNHDQHVAAEASNTIHVIVHHHVDACADVERNDDFTATREAHEYYTEDDRAALTLRIAEHEVKRSFLLLLGARGFLHLRWFGIADCTTSL